MPKQFPPLGAAALAEFFEKTMGPVLSSSAPEEHRLFHGLHIHGRLAVTAAKP